MALYLHETKINSPVIRMNVNYAAPVNQFTWKSIQEWARRMRDSGERTEAEYCAVHEVAGSDCLNFMLYTFVKGIENIEVRLGTYDFKRNNWRYGSLASMRLEHQPLSATPLGKYFDRMVEGKGNKRTVNLFWDLPFMKPWYEATAGPTVRMTSDFTDHTSVYLTADFGIDTSMIWGNTMIESMWQMFETGRLFRMATTEVQD